MAMTALAMIDVLGMEYDDLLDQYQNTPKWRFIRREALGQAKEAAWSAYMAAVRVHRDLTSGPESATLPA